MVGMDDLDEEAMAAMAEAEARAGAGAGAGARAGSGGLVRAAGAGAGAMAVVAAAGGLNVASIAPTDAELADVVLQMDDGEGWGESGMEAFGDLPGLPSGDGGGLTGDDWYMHGTGGGGSGAGGGHGGSNTSEGGVDEMMLEAMAIEAEREGGMDGVLSGITGGSSGGSSESRAGAKVDDAASSTPND